MATIHRYVNTNSGDGRISTKSDPLKSQSWRDIDLRDTLPGFASEVIVRKIEVDR